MFIDKFICWIEHIDFVMSRDSIANANERGNCAESTWGTENGKLLNDTSSAWYEID